MLPTKEISRVLQQRFSVAEGGDANRFIDLYADDVQYWDTKVPGRVTGKADLATYLGRFHAAFDTRYAVLEEHRLEGRDGAIVLWECAVRRRRPDGSLGRDLLMQRGMNLLEVRDGLITREESYMDLASVDALPA